MTIKQETAEAIGLQCLAWLVGNEDLLPVFMGATGVSEQDIKERAQEPEFLASVLEFLMMDDAWIVAFCNAQELPNDMPMRARAALPGGLQMDWT